MKHIFLGALIALPLAAAQAETITIEKEELGDLVREYLLENPEVIFEAVDVYNARQEAAAQEAVRAAVADNHAALYDKEKNVVIGNREGTTAIVEFIDYNCGYCRQSHEEMKVLFENNAELRVVLHQFPILSQGSLEAAQIVLATKFEYGDEDAEKLHNALYDYKGGPINGVVALDLAKELGLDWEELKSLAESQIVYDAIAGSQELAQELQIEGTPGFVIGAEVLGGYAPADVMQAFIDQI